MQLHFRCPVCGQQRPERAFALAGAHRLEALQLKGRGQGRGFERLPVSLTSDMLDFLAAGLSRALGQVDALRAHLHAAATASACPACTSPMVWTERGWACPRCW